MDYHDKFYFETKFDVGKATLNSKNQS